MCENIRVPPPPPPGIKLGYETILMSRKTPHHKINVNISKTDHTKVMNFTSFQSSVSHENKIAEKNISG